MDNLTALRNAETILHQSAAKLSALIGKLEDLTMRAHRIASAKRLNAVGPRDDAFQHDLQVFRREINSFTQDIESLPDVLVRTRRNGDYETETDELAVALRRMCERMGKALTNLDDGARLAHSHIRSSAAAVDAWYLVQQVSALLEKWQAVPDAADKMLNSFSSGRPS